MGSLVLVAVVAGFLFVACVGYSLERRVGEGRGYTKPVGLVSFWVCVGLSVLVFVLSFFLH